MEKEYKQLRIIISKFSNKSITESLKLISYLESGKSDNPLIRSLCRIYREACLMYSREVLPVDWKGEIRLTKDGYVTRLTVY